MDLLERYEYYNELAEIEDVEIDEEELECIDN